MSRSAGLSKRETGIPVLGAGMIGLFPGVWYTDVPKVNSGFFSMPQFLNKIDVYVNIFPIF
jgi:hypothetical protein